MVKDYKCHFITLLGNWSCDHPPDDPLDGPWQQPMKRAGQQWKAVNEKARAAMKHSQWKCQKQWQVVNEKGWPAVKSSHWNGLGCNEKQSMKRADLQWAVNEKSWPTMKSGQWKSWPAMKKLTSNEKQSMKRAGHQWKAVNENTRCNEKQLMKSCDLQWKVIEKHKASYEKIFFIKKGPRIYMIRFS